MIHATRGALWEVRWGWFWLVGVVLGLDLDLCINFLDNLLFNLVYNRPRLLTFTICELHEIRRFNNRLPVDPLLEQLTLLSLKPHNP